MLSLMTKVLLCVFSVAFLFSCVNSRSLTSRNRALQWKNQDKQSSSSQATIHASKHDSVPSTPAENTDLNSHRELKCQQNATKERRRRYATHGSKMKKMDITWGIAVYSKKLSHSRQRNIFEKAFKTWAANCRLSFIYTSYGAKADIVIKFVTGQNENHENHDLARGPEAHAFFPSAGSEIHFNETENWVANEDGEGGTSLLSVAIHYLGHSLGLRHSTVSTAVMYHEIQNGRNSLHDDDIKAIQNLYGSCSLQKVDAVLTGVRGFTEKALVFKNEMVWDVELSTGNINIGYPKKTSEYFNNALNEKTPFNAIFYETDYKTYVFMFAGGYTILDDARRFPVSVKDVSYTSSWTYYPFLKDAPDAAFVDPRNETIYHFFKGSQYYKFDMNSFEVLSGFPKAINDIWPGVPDNLDTAYYNYHENIYYFTKGDEVFKLDVKSGRYYSAGRLTDNLVFRDICPI